MFTTIFLLPLLTKAAVFVPESGSLLSNGVDNLPIPYNLTESQSKSSGYPAGSFWSSSFIHASDGHDYMVLSHVIQGTELPSGASTMYRASIVDITNPSRYSQFEAFSNITNIYADNGDFNATFPDYGFGSVKSKDDALAMRTWSSSVSGVQFDLNFELSSPVLLNGGLGFFQGINSVAYEWGMPAGKTTGWVSLNGLKVTVDTQKSLTWYDRQWNGAPESWTWFELHIDRGGEDKAVTPMSIWTYNTASGLGGLATIRETTGVQNVQPVASLQPSNRTYTSQATSIVYPLDWILQLSDGMTFYISSIRPDQELYGPGGGFPTYEGFITVTGVHKDGRKFNGYGVVEMFSSQPA